MLKGHLNLTTEYRPFYFQHSHILALQNAKNASLAALINMFLLGSIQGPFSIKKKT